MCGKSSTSHWHRLVTLAIKAFTSSGFSVSYRRMEFFCTSSWIANSSSPEICRCFLRFFRNFLRHNFLSVISCLTRYFYFRRYRNIIEVMCSQATNKAQSYRECKTKHLLHWSFHSFYVVLPLQSIKAGVARWMNTCGLTFWQNFLDLQSTL